MHKCEYCSIQAENCVQVTTTINGDNETFFCCCGKCRSKTLEFYSLFNKTARLFIIGIILSVGVLLTGIFIQLLLAVGCALLGVIVIIFPFGTPETFALLGIKKTIMFVRTIGIITVIGSAFMAIFF